MLCFSSIIWVLTCISFKLGIALRVKEANADNPCGCPALIPVFQYVWRNVMVEIVHHNPILSIWNTPSWRTLFIYYYYLLISYCVIRPIKYVLKISCKQDNFTQDGRPKCEWFVKTSRCLENSSNTACDYFRNCTLFIEYLGMIRPISVMSLIRAN